MPQPELADMLNFSGATVVVTGAAGGFGKATMSRFGAAGARVIGLDKDKDGASDAVQIAVGQGASEDSFGLGIDVRDHSNVRDVFQQIEDRAGQVSTLVNSVGVREVTDVLDIDATEWDNVIAINLSGTFYCCQAAAQIMVKAEPGGFPRSIVNIASVAGLIGISHRPAYTASKHGVVGLTKNLAKDLAKHEIRVNVIAPGTIRTPLTEHYYHNEEFVSGLDTFVPLGSGGSADDVAHAILFLSSPVASFITGAVLPVDGGWVAEKGYSLPGSASPYFQATTTITS